MLPCPLSRPLSITPDTTTSGRDPSACRRPAPDLQKTAQPPLLSVVLVRLHRPEPLVMAGRVRAGGLRRVAVDQRPHIHRVCGATHLVLDREQVPAIGGIDDVAETGFILVVLAKKKLSVPLPRVRTGEVGDVHLHLVAVGYWRLPICLAQ